MVEQTVIKIDVEVYEAICKKARRAIRESPNKILRRMLGLPEPRKKPVARSKPSPKPVKGQATLGKS